jgi:hypothetical protein
VEVAQQHFNLSVYTLLIRNDCSGALTAMRKGSSRSPILQAMALEGAKLCAAQGARSPLGLHAPGKELILEGIDGLSRDAAAATRVVESQKCLRDLSKDMVRKAGWPPLTLDVFATAENTVTPRFLAATAEPFAEAVDALVHPDWNSSVCPHCQCTCREVLFVFPPRDLLKAALRKAKADRTRGIFVVPLAVTAPYWRSLMHASVAPLGSEKYCVVRAARNISGVEVYNSVKLAVVAADFGSFNLLPSHFPHPCGQEAAHRPRRPVPSLVDLQDRCRIQALISQRAF